jgi:hypothetical protein
VVQDSAEVTDAVTVAVGEAAGIDLVDHGRLPPIAPDHGAGVYLTFHLPICSLTADVNR